MKNKILKILTEVNNSSYVYRKLMSKEEINLCNKLIKDGLLYKSKPDEINATIAYFITNKGKNFLEK